MIGLYGIPQIAANFSIIVPRIGFPGNPETLPQVFDERAKALRAAKYGSICRTNRRAIDNSLLASIGFRQQVLCRHGCFFSCDRLLVQLQRRLLEKRILAFKSQARRRDNPCSSLVYRAGGCKNGTNE
jgi:hypothetical protein